VRSFSEEGRPPSIPAPLIRAVEGTDVIATVRNTLNEELRVFGLCSPPGPCQPIAVPAGQTQDVRFSLTTAGTYYYWATTRGQTLTSRPLADSQLGGAIVVDPRQGAAADRVMVVSMYQGGSGPGPCGLANTTPDSAFVINGASWPHTERLRYTTGESVRWRVINLSCDQHAMHLHGFHFVVEASGDGSSDHLLAAAERRTEVTENLPPGRTFAMAWTPTRPGNWLFHCHMVVHMAPAAAAAHPMHDLGSDAGMAGLVVGIEVSGQPLTTPESSLSARRVSMFLREDPNRYGSAPGFRVDIADAPRLDPGPVPGPVLVLHRGEPTEITVVNEMKQPSAIHWHGLEIESYYDGVPGFGGDGDRIAPPIVPGESFVARITPPRSGTFIYHTHWHDEAQLAGGLYGPILVLEPGERFDPETDHVVMIGLNGQVKPGTREPFALNGLASPAAVRLKAGAPNRLRLINITPANVALIASLVDNGDPVEWRPLAKDGAALPQDASKARRARQPIAVGETYDFEVPARSPGNLWLEVRRGNGEWVLQAPVQIR
jgi:FtsP/CotA-like multicopper oxidase with cupredoxin domain